MICLSQHCKLFGVTHKLAKFYSLATAGSMLHLSTYNRPYLDNNPSYACISARIYCMCRSCIQYIRMNVISHFHVLRMRKSLSWMIQLTDVKFQHCVGCLCEEMGLGKTVEVIACILSHPCSDPAVIPTLKQRISVLSKDPTAPCGACGHPATSHSGRVRCTGCSTWMHAACVGNSNNTLAFDSKRKQMGAAHTLLCGACLRALASQQVEGQSRTTLVVCPPAIMQQWFDELQRHVIPGALKILTYAGQSQSLLSSSEGVCVSPKLFRSAQTSVLCFALVGEFVPGSSDLHSHWCRAFTPTC